MNATETTPRRRRGALDPRVRSIRDLYPFESHYVELGGPRMHYLDEGDGPPVVMLHGNPTWSFHFRELISALRGEHRVIVPDHVGCGLSDKPPDYPYTLATHGDNLERLIDHLGLDEVTLAVHDWGGPIGFAWAVRHPVRVRSLVIFNTAAFLGGRVPRRIAMCRPPVVGEVLIQGLNGFLRASFHMAAVKRLPRSVRRGYLLPYQGIASRVGILRFVRDIPDDPAVPSRAVLRRIEQGLSQLADRPAVIFWGMRDFCFTDSFLHEWMLRFPRAQVHCLHDAGHYVIEDARDEIIPRLRAFLRHDSRPSVEEAARSVT